MLFRITRLVEIVGRNQLFGDLVKDIRLLRCVVPVGSKSSLSSVSLVCLN